MAQKVWLKGLSRDEYVDKITIEVVPRYKTSEVSGDEWRIRAVMRFWRKGHVVYERSFTNMNYATASVPWLFQTFRETEEFEFIDTEKQGYCFQPGCSEKATVTVNAIKEYSTDGCFSKVITPDDTFKIQRRFCDKHKQRGDCSLEDRDSNYEAVEGS